MPSMVLSAVKLSTGQMEMKAYRRCGASSLANTVYRAGVPYEVPGSPGYSYLVIYFPLPRSPRSRIPVLRTPSNLR